MSCGGSLGKGRWITVFRGRVQVFRSILTLYHWLRKGKPKYSYANISYTWAIQYGFIHCGFTDVLCPGDSAFRQDLHAEMQRA